MIIVSYFDFTKPLKSSMLALMKHYVCTGECGGVADHPKNCGDKSCSMHDKPLHECNCEDGKHADAKGNKMSPVVHFEMPAKDHERVKNFYTQVFGWQMNQLGPEMGNYILAGTSPVDENQMFLKKGVINGGFFDYKDEVGFNAPHVVIEVKDLIKSIELVKKAGGEVMGDTMEIFGIGKYQSIKDSEGNVVGMLQPQKDN